MLSVRVVGCPGYTNDGHRRIFQQEYIEGLHRITQNQASA
jgi:hypothetical protein